MLFLQMSEDVLRPSEPLMTNRAVPQTMVSMFGSQSFREWSPVRGLGQRDNTRIVYQSRG